MPKRDPNLPFPPRYVPKKAPPDRQPPDPQEELCVLCSAPLGIEATTCRTCMTALNQAALGNWSEEQKAAWIARRRQEVEDDLRGL